MTASAGFRPLPTSARPDTLIDMDTINADQLHRLPLTDIETVTFYKRDEITTDLICCHVAIGGKVWTFHEELVGWDLLIQHLQRLPNFRMDWFSAVTQPPFAKSEIVAFIGRRADPYK